MSRAPFVIGKAESPYSSENQTADSTLGARFANPAIVKQFGNEWRSDRGGSFPTRDHGGSPLQRSGGRFAAVSCALGSARA
jgi:hypothetical protein